MEAFKRELLVKCYGAISECDVGEFRIAIKCISDELDTFQFDWNRLFRVLLYAACNKTEADVTNICDELKRYPELFTGDSTMTGTVFVRRDENSKELWIDYNYFGPKTYILEQCLTRLLCCLCPDTLESALTYRNTRDHVRIPVHNMSFDEACVAAESSVQTWNNRNNREIELRSFRNEINYNNFMIVRYMHDYIMDIEREC